MSSLNSSSSNSLGSVLTSQALDFSTNDVTCYPNKLFENDFKLHGQENHGREGMVMPNEVFKNPSNDFISNIKESVDVTFATDDDKQLEAHNKTVTN